MLYSKVQENIKERLKLLNKDLTYHNARHTLSDVLSSAIYMAEKLNLNEEDCVLLKTAVLFHDLGYLQQYDNNEYIGAKMAEEILPLYEFTSSQINTIKQMILATQFPQTPSSLLERIICDADLDSLHRGDFLELGENLRKELGCYKNNIKELDWLNVQLEFIKDHTYHLDVDLNKRNNGKLVNISLLEKRISIINES